MSRILAISLALAGLLVALSPRLAGAHAAFITSDPAPDSVVPVLPDQVRLLFSEDISRSSSVIVLAPDGSTVSGDTMVDGNVAMTSVAPAGPGVYIVQWSNVSLDDGHESSGLFQFTVVSG
jgi:methionine-rich copper-binding protein CopC